MPSVIASQCRRKSRDLPITASQSGKKKIEGVVSSVRRVRKISNVHLFLSQGGYRVYASGHATQELGVEYYDCFVGCNVFYVHRHGHTCEGGNKLGR